MVLLHESLSHLLWSVGRWSNEGMAGGRVGGWYGYGAMYSLYGYHNLMSVSNIQIYHLQSYRMSYSAICGRVQGCVWWGLNV